MFWPLGIGSPRRDLPPPYKSKMSLPAEGAVVLLGAGASAPVGAPLMRGFIDLARDYMHLKVFDSDAVDDVKATLNLYDELRSQFLITEEDIENIENLLSIAELADLVQKLPISKTLPLGMAASVRRFVEAVLVKAIRMPAPNSSIWLGPGASVSQHKNLVFALAYYKEKLTIVTLNYDCALEYACYCLGVPFTYNRLYGDGAEILKLHGSINWLVCQDKKCTSYNKPFVSNLKHTVFSGKNDFGTIEPEQKKCSHCSGSLRPVIVPPTWEKNLEQETLRDTWERAFEVLLKADTLVSIGYSLPNADPKARELLHVGLSSANLRQAMIVVGHNEESASRWKKHFRESWRNYRLDVRMQNFEELGNTNLFNALSIGSSAFTHKFTQLLPFSKSLHMDRDTLERFESRIKELDLWNTEVGSPKFDLEAVARNIRLGKADGTSMEEILVEFGFNWTPSGPILPTHGDKLGRH